MSVKQRPASQNVRLRQQPIGPWPIGLSCVAATVRLEPEELTERLGIEFAESHDELDQLKAAIVELQSERRVAFVRHLGCPEPGTEIWVEEGSLQEHPLDGVFADLSLDSGDVLWKKPGIP